MTYSRNGTTVCLPDFIYLKMLFEMHLRVTVPILYTATSPFWTTGQPSCLLLLYGWIGILCFAPTVLLLLDSHRISCTFSLQTFIPTKLTSQHIWSFWGNQSRLQIRFIAKIWVCNIWLLNKIASKLFIASFCDITYMLVNSMAALVGRHWYHLERMRT